MYPWSGLQSGPAPFFSPDSRPQVRVDFRVRTTFSCPAIRPDTTGTHGLIRGYSLAGSYS